VFDSVPSDAVGYVASAYLFFLLMVLVYIAILGAKFQRINRDLAELIDEIEADREDAVTASGGGDRTGGADSCGSNPDAEDKSGKPADSPHREESSV
jgi:hypothetical protein